MSFALKEFIKGIVLRGETTDITDNIEGSLFHNSSSKKLKTYLNSQIRELITDSQQQTLTNKTIDYNLNTIINLPGGGGGGGGANLDLSNINTTAIPNGSNLYSLGSLFRIGTLDSSSANTGAVSLETGNVNAGAFTSGNLFIRTGINVANGPTGYIQLSSNKSLTGVSGATYIGTASIDPIQNGFDNSTNMSRTGNIQINTGPIRNTTSPSKSGDVYLGSGTTDSLGGSGEVDVTSGKRVGGTGTTGDVIVQSGKIENTSVSGTTGSVTIQSGNNEISGNTGNVIIMTGGTVSGTRGNIILDANKIFADTGSALVVTTFNRTLVNAQLPLDEGTQVYHKDISANTSFEFLNGVSGKKFSLVVKNSTGSSYTISFPNVSQKAGTIDGTVSANSSTILDFIISNGEYFCVSCVKDIVAPITPPPVTGSIVWDSFGSSMSAGPNGSVVRSPVANNFTESSYNSAYSVTSQETGDFVWEFALEENDSGSTQLIDVGIRAGTYNPALQMWQNMFIGIHWEGNQNAQWILNGGGFEALPSSLFTTNTSHIIKFILTGTTLKAYIDGTLIKTQLSVLPVDCGGTFIPYIAMRSSSNLCTSAQAYHAEPITMIDTAAYVSLAPYGGAQFSGNGVPPHTNGSYGPGYSVFGNWGIISNLQEALDFTWEYQVSLNAAGNPTNGAYVTCVGIRNIVLDPDATFTNFKVGIVFDAGGTGTSYIWKEGALTALPSVPNSYITRPVFIRFQRIGTTLSIYIDNLLVQTILGFNDADCRPGLLAWFLADNGTINTFTPIITSSRLS